MKGKSIVIAAIIVIGVALIVLNMSGDDRPKRLPVAEGFDAPDITLKTTDGTPWQLSANRGNVILINFWAEWCDTCKDEMPSLQRLYDILKDDPNFRLVSILYNDDPDVAMGYLEENNYTIPLYLDPGGAAASTFGLTGVPETYVIGKNGVLRKKFIGPVDFDNPDALAFFKRILAESP